MAHDEKNPAFSERVRESRDHLARRFLTAALDLGQVLRRHPGPAGRFRQGFLPALAEGMETPAENLPP
jgi:hypothetical protein